mmetsp:Transcript_31432/g.39026  ORF Transcript_31432/g.39026 Transcript_31432/m.39026 type:complete len:126 (+) Transcript_31432:3231-3608(+)
MQNLVRRQTDITTSMKGGNMQGLHTYNLLANKTYYDRFMYLPYSLKDRKSFIVSMYKHEEMRECSIAVVRCATDLAFMPTGRAKALEFNAEYIWKHWNGDVDSKPTKAAADEEAVDGVPVSNAIQ